MPVWEFCSSEQQVALAAPDLALPDKEVDLVEGLKVKGDDLMILLPKAGGSVWALSPITISSSSEEVGLGPVFKALVLTPSGIQTLPLTVEQHTLLATLPEGAESFMVFVQFLNHTFWLKIVDAPSDGSVTGTKIIDTKSPWFNPLTGDGHAFVINN